MQRRPLEPIPFNEDDFLTPLERLANVFLQRSNENNSVVCNQPLVHFENYNRLFQTIGFAEIPVHPKGEKLIRYPKNAPLDEHPTGFLQFGAQIKSKKHVIFEIGNFNWLIRYDFKQSYPEAQDTPICQLDELQIWDGDVRFHLDCEDRAYKPCIDLVTKIVSNTIKSMWEENYQGAKAEFEKMGDVIKNLNDLSDRNQAHHNAEWMASKIAERGQQKRNTP